MSYRHPLMFAFAALLVCSVQLLSEHLSGGIHAHHLLNQADLPAISNAWGLLVLPLLGGCVGMRVQAKSGLTAAIVLGFVAAAGYGAALAAAFEFGHALLTQVLFFGLLLPAVLLPVFRAECLLGFVIGMTYTFGAVLPALFGSLFALLSALLHPVFRMAWRRRAG